MIAKKSSFKMNFLPTDQDAPVEDYKRIKFAADPSVADL